MILLCGRLANPESISLLARSTEAPQLKNGPENKGNILAKATSITIPFVKNVGQFAAGVTYAADLFAGRFFLTGNELVYAVHKLGESDPIQPGKRGLRADTNKRQAFGESLVFKEFFVDKKGARIGFASLGEQKSETVVSYFKGSDAAKWRSGVASYQGVSLGEIFSGVEVKLKASGRNIEKVFYVSPRGNVDAIKIGVAGVDGLKIAEDGRLLLTSSFGELAMRAPVAWQEIAGQRRSVKVSYRLLGKRLYGFTAAGDYATDRELVIDPSLEVLQASTFLGGSKYNYGYSLALDSAGNVYVTGSTHSPDFPTTDGAYDREFDEVDVFVSKLDGDLTTLLASTFLSGNEYDSGSCLVLDGDGNVCLAGVTKSTDFPTTDGAYDRTFNGDNFYTNVFISKLNGGLTQLLASTLMGGYVGQDVTSLALDGSGNIYLAGSTRSPDFPTTTGAYDRTCNAIWNDAFVSKLNGSLTQLLASTFLGGAMGDACWALALDGAGSVYLTGGTSSEDFPTTTGAYDRVFKKKNWPDVFVSKLDGDLTTLTASTLLGGAGFDGGRALALDGAGNVYVTGDTGSPDFPTTTGAYDRTYNDQPVQSGLGGDAFVSILNNDLTALLASTFLGGSKADKGVTLALGASGDVYLGGLTESADLPATPECYDPTYNEGGDVFAAKLNGGLSALLAATYLGGTASILAAPSSWTMPAIFI